MAITDARLELLTAWLARDLTFGAERIAPASEDASFRRYFRIWRDGETFIVMDAPPEKLALAPYLAIAGMLTAIGVHVPRVLAEEHGRGFLLVTDLGTRQYLDDLEVDQHVEAHYLDAMMALSRIQSRGQPHAAHLPPYDRKLLEREMQLMPEWFCERHLKLALSDAERTVLADAFELLCREALAQPQVFVHRDYHSRNLMVCPGDNPGILDFQDAVRGPVTYDLVSLFRDCYIGWPAPRVRDWALRYREMAAASGVDIGPDEARFMRWFDLMGAQRHLKVLGIFARLCHRDGKRAYLDDLPLTLEYVLDVSSRHPELTALARFLERRVSPLLATRRAEALA
ncbi:MAG TPA: phosphotransferase [Steroidobacteraceae bacterium]|nr:phosphotransferase [Steroidobacteraceae bacterium]